MAFVGCSGGVKEETITINPANNDPLMEPRSILKQYADGQQMGSEVANFPVLVENLRKTDPAKADILEKGLADLQKARPAELKEKAKELYNKLGPASK